MGRFIKVVALVSCALIGCTAVDGPPVEDVVGEPAVEGEQARGIYVRGDHSLSPYFTARAAMAPRHRIIYMNREGGTYSPGYDDSVANKSSIPGFTATVPPWDVSDSGWQEVMDCMTELWSPFDVEITDVDPGDVDHIESVVAGRPQDIGMGSGVGGVSPFDCGVIERSIVFTFARVYGDNYRDICETAAQEVAHSFALDHQYMCEDPMTYLYGCGEKSFQDVDANCGEYSSRSCSCGGSKQNSVQLLLAANGAADILAPVVSISDPVDGSIVEPGFEIRVDADDDKVVSQVEVVINGQSIGSLTEPPWVFAAGDLADGTYEVTAIASDGKHTSEATIKVGIGDPPDDGSDPPGDGDDEGVDGRYVVGGCSTGGSGGPLGLLGLLYFAATFSRRLRSL